MSVINWTEAMQQVGDDTDFLFEVLNDLIKEAITAKDEIDKAIQDDDYDGVRKAGHRIKGSASYLSCYALRDVSEHLQDAGRKGISEGKSAAQMEEIKHLYKEFCNCLDELEKEVEARKKK